MIRFSRQANVFFHRHSAERNSQISRQSQLNHKSVKSKNHTNMTCNPKSTGLCQSANCQICFDHSLASTSASKLWNYEMNSNLVPRNIYKFSGIKYWFECKQCNHTIFQNARDMSCKKDCSYCCLASKMCKSLECHFCYQKSFATSNKCHRWNSIKNGDSNPRLIFLNSTKKFWFDCDQCNHAYQSSPADVNKAKGCIYCSNKKLCEDKLCEICVKNSFVSSARIDRWDYTKNIIDPRTLPISALSVHWFKCNICEHSYTSNLVNVNKSKSCRFCDRKELCSNSECQLCFENSFASCSQSQYLKNANARQIFKNSNGQLFQFECNDCHHTFHKRIQDAVRGSWCNFCSHHAFCDDYCEICFQNSFASNEKCQFLVSEKNDPNINLQKITKTSQNKLWFKCDACFHEFIITCCSVSEGKWCTFCAFKDFCLEQSCKFCFDRSFASCEDSKYWCYKSNGDLIPRNISKWSKTKVTLTCNICSQPFKISIGSAGKHWCPCVKKKTEQKVYTYLTELSNSNHEISIEREKIFEWCPSFSSKQWYRFDFLICLQNQFIILELDGKAHFEDVVYWKSDMKLTQKKDIYKMIKAIVQKIPIIRLCQEDCWNDTIDWKQKLKDVFFIKPINQVTYIAKNPDQYTEMHSKLSEANNLKLISL